VNTDGWTISDMDGCSRVGRLLASGTLETVFEHCGENIVTLSPGWAPGPRLALADNGEVYDTASGALVQTLDLPHDMLALSDSIHLEYGGWWRGSASNDVAPKVFFSFTVDLTNIYNDVNLEHRYESVIIGCRVTTGECGQQFRSRADAPNVPFVWR
jgi:hypothetical protein